MIRLIIRILLHFHRQYPIGDIASKFVILHRVVIAILSLRKDTILFMYTVQYKSVSWNLSRLLCNDFMTPPTYDPMVQTGSCWGLVGINISLEPLSSRPCTCLAIHHCRPVVSISSVVSVVNRLATDSNIPATLWPFVNLVGDLISNASVGRRIGQRGESPVVQRWTGLWLIAIFAALSWTSL